VHAQIDADVPAASLSAIDHALGAGAAGEPEQFKLAVQVDAVNSTTPPE